MKTKDNAPIAVSRDAVRHAFSYLEKARALAASSHIERADGLLKALRAQMQQDIAAAGEELQAALRSQAKLTERSAVRSANAVKANERNRELAARIEHTRMRIKDLNALLAARRSVDLGEFIDAPLEDYQAHITCPRKPTAVKRGGLLSALIVDKPTLAGIQLKPTRLGLVVWGIALLAACCASLLYLGSVRLGGTLALDLALTGGPNNPIVVTIHNNGASPIEIRVPLPEGGVASSDGAEGARICGLRAWAREDGAKEFRLIPASMNCWMNQDPKLDEHPPVTVPPRLAAQLLFATDKLPGSKSFRIALVRPDGTLLAQQEITFK